MFSKSLFKFVFVATTQIILLAIFTSAAFACTGGGGGGEWATIWCPTGQAPVPSENGCTQIYTSINSLLTFLKSNEADPTYQQAGTIYIKTGEYIGTESQFNFNAYNYTSFNSYDLTIQGAWDPTTNTVDGEAGYTSFTSPFILGTDSAPWGGTVTIQNIKISRPAKKLGIVAYAQGTVSVHMVDVTRVEGNNGGTLVSKQGDVIVTNSSFTKNKRGAYVKSAGMVIFNNNYTHFDGNQTDGVVVEAVGNVFITNSTFNSNGSISSKTIGRGLTIENGGVVSITASEAIKNNYYGANIIATGTIAIYQSNFDCNHGGANCTPASSMNKAKSDIAPYCGGGTNTTGVGYGLKAFSSDSVRLNVVTADMNYTFGAELNAPNGVSVAESTFNQNSNSSTYSSTKRGKGLIVESTGGVSLSSVEANDNPTFGGELAGNDVSVSSSQFMASSKGYGFHIESQSTVYVDNVTASDSDTYGGKIEASSDVNVSNSTFNNIGSLPIARSNGSRQCSNGHGIGLAIKSDTGFVTVSNVQANENGKNGTEVTTNGMAVYLIDGIFARNGLNGATVSSAENVSVINSTFEQNGLVMKGSGLRINKATSVDLTTATATDNGMDGVLVNVQGVTVNVYDGVFTGNAGYGIKAQGSTVSINGTPVFGNNTKGDYYPA